MRFSRLTCAALAFALALPVVANLATPSAYAQETTGSLQGTVKDPTGAALPGVKVTVSTPSLVGVKSELSDSKGYYHFSNLPPGSYVIEAEAKGFKNLKKTGFVLEVGHSPSLDLTLPIGAATDTVDVTADVAPLVDVTSVTTLTNVTADEIAYVPRGTSFQSVIQFAPSARNEPLMGNTTTNGSGSVSPGNGSNGSSFGYSIAGAADSENSYLVEGQETANLIGGYSHTNVPFDFIQEVEIKSSGVQAEYGGALGGVVNVIMKKGSPHYHGSVFAQYENQGLDAGLNAFPRYDPSPAGTISPTAWTGTSLPTCGRNTIPGDGEACYQGFADATYQSYQPFKPKTSDVFPGFTIGGPLFPKGGMRDKLFFFVGFNPQMTRYENSVNYGTGVGVVPFSQNTNTYYTTARVDAQVTKKIRVFGSWLYQLQKQYGENLPSADSKQGYLNVATTNPLTTYAHTLGYTAPNTTVNTGADYTITPSIVSTTRFGYYFENYHDFGYPSGGVVYQYEVTGLGGTAGQISGPLDQQTNFNSSKAIELDQDFSWYKSTKYGTHNFKFGYQLNRNSNLIQQVYNEPYVQIFPDTQYAYGSPEGQANCAIIDPAADGTNACSGTDGYAVIYDFGTAGSAIAYDNGFFGQDSWTLGKGITLDYGVRLEKEYLPGEAVGGGAPQKPIDFGWGDKIAVRLGGAWDVFRNGKMKVFGGYGQFYDQMKLNVAISSFGGQYWNNCVYALNTTDLSSIDPQFNSSKRYCPGSGGTSTQALFANGTTPAGLSFIENLNQRAFPTTCSTCSSQQEGVAPGLKPYEQHEALGGIDYQFRPTIAFEVRYDRRRLDHVIEDAAVYNPDVGETFVIVNPGQGVNHSISTYCNFLYGQGNPGCIPASGSVAPPSQNPGAARSYDGIEFRATKAVSHGWAGLFSYTYSKLRGNYTGLTSSDLSDGGSGGRNSPNNSRAFDEPYFQYNDNGQSSSGLLPTDRPNTLKGNAYYQVKFLHNFTTNFGIFQYFYQGSPNTAYTDVGLSFNAFPVKPFDWGKWANITQNPATGEISVGSTYTNRNPWYIQTDFQIDQEYRIKEGMSVKFSATATNMLNQHAVTAIDSQIDSSYDGNQYVAPGGQNLGGGLGFYGVAEAPYNLQDSLNGLATTGGAPSNSQGGPETINSQYGKPLYYQHPRQIRLQASFTF